MNMTFSVGKAKKRKKKKKVSENNGQIRFVRHHGWHMQVRLDQKSHYEVLVNTNQTFRTCLFVCFYGPYILNEYIENTVNLILTAYQTGSIQSWKKLAAG